MNPPTYSYSLTIEPTLEGFEHVADALGNYNKERFVAAMEDYKCGSPQVLELLASHIATARIKLDAEYIRLHKFSQVFNSEFATDYNNCFSAGLAMLGKMRGGVSMLKKIYRRFCPNDYGKARRYGLRSASPRAAIDNSKLGLSAYSIPLYSIESYPPEVQALEREMGLFMLVLHNCFRLCIKMLNEEAEVRKNGEQALHIYRKFKKKILKELKSILKTINLDQEEYSASNSKAVAMREQMSEIEFSQKGFHQFNVEEAVVVVTKELCEEAKSNDLTHDEIVLFGQNTLKVRKIRTIISQFDSYVPEEYANKKKLHARLIASLYRWSGAEKKNQFVEYFLTSYKAFGGKLDVPGLSAVYGENKNVDTLSHEYLLLQKAWNEVTPQDVSAQQSA